MPSSHRSVNQNRKSITLNDRSHLQRFVGETGSRPCLMFPQKLRPGDLFNARLLLLRVPRVLQLFTFFTSSSLDLRPTHPHTQAGAQAERPNRCHNRILSAISNLALGKNGEPGSVARAGKMRAQAGGQNTFFFPYLHPPLGHPSGHALNASSLDRERKPRTPTMEINFDRHGGSLLKISLESSTLLGVLLVLMLLLLKNESVRREAWRPFARRVTHTQTHTHPLAGFEAWLESG